MGITQQQADEMRQRVASTEGSMKRKLAQKPNIQVLKEAAASLRDGAKAEFIAACEGIKPVKNRVRQSSRPLLNCLETEWFNYLSVRQPGWPEIKYLRAQAIKFKIAANAFYKPDMTATLGGKMVAWECKGLRGKNIDRGILALKVTAHQWPEVEFRLVWKDREGQWQSQTIIS